MAGFIYLKYFALQFVLPGICVFHTSDFSLVAYVFFRDSTLLYSTHSLSHLFLRQALPVWSRQASCVVPAQAFQTRSASGECRACTPLTEDRACSFRRDPHAALREEGSALPASH